MNGASILEAVTSEGLVVTLAESGSLKVAGEQEMVNRWRPLLKQYKAEIIRLLSKQSGDAPTLPSWCNSRCEHFHRLEVLDLGTMQWCCQEMDETHWRRLRIGTMTGCPLQEA